MIISHKYKFIFIKTKKTAGTSIEVFLSQLCDKNDVVTPIHPTIEGHIPRNHKTFFNCFSEIMLLKKNRKSIQTTIANFRARKKFFNHIPGYLIRERVSKSIWDNYFKFCVERNPWDKALSSYHMVRNRLEKPDLLFDDFLDNEYHRCVNHPYYMDITNSEIIVDRVLKYERLNEELTTVFNKLSIPFNGTLGVNAKSHWRKERSDYRQNYTTEQKEQVEKIFQKEIALHGYSF